LAASFRTCPSLPYPHDPFSRCTQRRQSYTEDTPIVKSHIVLLSGVVTTRSWNIFTFDPTTRSVSIASRSKVVIRWHGNGFCEHIRSCSQPWHSDLERPQGVWLVSTGELDDDSIKRGVICLVVVEGAKNIYKDTELRLGKIYFNSVQRIEYDPPGNKCQRSVRPVLIQSFHILHKLIESFDYLAVAPLRK